MNQVKFTFDTHFDSGTGEPVAYSEKRSRKIYSSDEIDAMCVRAREEERSGGEIRAKQAMAAAISQLASAVETIENQVEAIRSEAAQLALAAARLLAGAALNSA